jgi:glycosyltransferase involved in cell wall biosynthesis
MNQVFDELTEAFKDYECQIRVVNSFDDLENGGIIFLDNAAGLYYHNKDIYMKIANKCPNTVFICWYWCIDPYFIPFEKIIFTGEYYLSYENIGTEKIFYFYLPKYVPLKLRANDSPCLIGTYIRNVSRDFCFMGHGYKEYWVPSGFSGIYHDTSKNRFLSYEERKQIYLSSIFAFGFQSEENIENKHFSQRIFEGMAYGCVVLCENEDVEEFTEGAVIYVSSKEDLINKMNFYKANPDLIKEKQNQGYEWVKKYGTNRSSIKDFLDKIKELYDEEFEN